MFVMTFDAWFQFAQPISLELVERDWLIRLKPVKCNGKCNRMMLA
jgi:hypothetical protein